MKGGGKGIGGKGVGEDFLRLREAARNLALDHVIAQSRTPMVIELRRMLDQEREEANRDALDANATIVTLRTRAADLEARAARATGLLQQARADVAGLIPNLIHTQVDSHMLPVLQHALNRIIDAEISLMEPNSSEDEAEAEAGEEADDEDR